MSKSNNIIDRVKANIKANKQLMSSTYPFSKQQDNLQFVEPKTEVQLLDLARQKKMAIEDYWCTGGLLDETYLSPDEPVKNDNIAYKLVTVGDHTVGFIKTVGIGTKDKSRIIAPNDAILSTVYVKPEYRGWGVASRIYQAIDTPLELSLHRIKDKMGYWQKFYNYISPNLGTAISVEVDEMNSVWGQDMLCFVYKKPDGIVAETIQPLQQLEPLTHQGMINTNLKFKKAIKLKHKKQPKMYAYDFSGRASDDIECGQ
jgi:GNAT superfamily N-acetyltransferase